VHAVGVSASGDQIEAAAIDQPRVRGHERRSLGQVDFHDFILAAW
jgi:hypothetical protein